MNEEVIEDLFTRKRAQSSYQLMLEYKSYLKEKKLNSNQKTIFKYKDTKLAFTDKQIEVLKLIAKGFSNIKIAQMLRTKEPTIKLLVYRLMKHLETILYEKIDRYYLIIIAQELSLELKFDTSQNKPIE